MGRPIRAILQASMRSLTLNASNRRSLVDRNRLVLGDGPVRGTLGLTGLRASKRWRTETTTRGFESYFFEHGESSGGGRNRFAGDSSNDGRGHGRPSVRRQVEQHRTRAQPTFRSTARQAKTGAAGSMSPTMIGSLCSTAFSGAPCTSGRGLVGYPDVGRGSCRLGHHRWRFRW
jgi:hypothetical protein